MANRVKRAIRIKKITASEYETFDGHFQMLRDWEPGKNVAWSLMFIDADGERWELGDPWCGTLAECTHEIVDIRNTEAYKTMVAEKMAVQMAKQEAEK